MIRHHVQKSASDAKRYYATPDYYAEGSAHQNEFGGKGAELLGIAGPAEKLAFDRLCDNLHPLTGEQLTQRMNAERIVGIDFTFDGPKGFAVLEALASPEERRQLREALRLAGDETMREMEAVAGTRVRKSYQRENRTTGNLLWYRAPHDTTRPVEGVPDMQPHDHYFVLNATFDPVEKQWKAANLYDILQDMPYYQAAFHQRLAGRLEAMGYAVERQGNFFEVSGIQESVIRKFSRRQQLIEQTAKEEGITDPKAKSELGAKTREKKAKNLSMDQLRRQWISRLTSEEQVAVMETHLRAKERELSGERPSTGVNVRDAMRHAAEHVFVRKSAAPARELLATALAFGVGSFRVEDAWKHLEQDGRFTAEVDGRLFVASSDVLAEEQYLVKQARAGRGTQAPLDPHWQIEDTRLNVAQRGAVHHLLGSTDFVSMVIGDAGTGKTTLLKEAVRGANAAGVQVIAVAPSAAASRINLEQEGFTGAETVARLLVDKQLQAQARGQVILIDEAAMMGTKETAAVMKLAGELNARLWLVGDDKQHKIPTRGSPFDLLQKDAGIVPARVARILRQAGAYKKAVLLARDRPAEALDQLQAMGWVREVGDDQRYKLLAADYLEAVKPERKRGKTVEPTALVIAPTHAEGAKVSAAIREGLKEQGRLGEEREFLQLTNRHLTQAERSDRYSYLAGDVLQFTQNAKGHQRGERLAVIEGQEPPAHLAERFQVYRPGTLKVAGGDRLRLTANGSTKDGHRLNNGELLTVSGFTKAGDVMDHRGWVLPKDWGHWQMGYVTTSVSAQSRTVDRVLIAMGSESLPAINREQMYVSLSRGKEWARLYTGDAKALVHGVQKADVHVSATELARLRETQRKQRGRLLHHVWRTRRREEMARPRVGINRPIDKSRQPGLEKSMAYE